ncbi:MAG: DUF1552 domain-containing protein [Myxococcota bacterium]
MTRYAKILSRRTFLRGAGSVAIGFPLLSAMQTRTAWGAPSGSPVRAFNLFFGLGIPKEIQAEGLQGALEPLAPFADRFAWLRGVNLYEADGRGNNHFDGGGGVFCGVEPQSDSLSGGPSVDQVIKEACYGAQYPSAMIPTLAMGSFFRRSRLTRYVHNWNQQGAPAALPLESPQALFDRVFGSDEPTDDPDARRTRHRRSVLDGVLEQYRSWSGGASPLGPDDRAKLADHLDRLREYEQRAFPEPNDTPVSSCESGTRPGSLPLLHGQAPDPDGEGVDIELDEWVDWWRSMVDIYVLALACDRTRFGGVMFQSAGERIRLKGRYRYEGRDIYDFDDRRDRGRGGSGGCSHEFWHRYNRSNENPELRHHTHFMMAQLAYFLERMDGVQDESGGSLLDTSLLTISTELGDGNPHNLESVFHMVSRAGGRFQAGTFDVDVEGLDVYNTVLDGFGISERLGPATRGVQQISGLLA